MSQVRDTVPSAWRMYAYWTPDFDVTVTSNELAAVGVPTSVAPNFAVAGASTARLSLAAPTAWFSVGSIAVRST